MPTVIIRPITAWREETISDDNVTIFWEKINSFWRDFVDAMDTVVSNHSEPLQQPLVTPESMFWVHECLNQHSSYFNASANDPELDSAGCPVIFDSWKCWPPAQPGQTVSQHCPDFADLGFDQNRLAYKSCTNEGFWWRHPQSNQSWSNYTQCVNLQELKFRQTVNVISLSGLGISLFALLLSLLIFFYFKNLNCGRIKMHKNLFLALAMNNFCWILWYTCVLYRPEVSNSNPVWCRVLHVVKNYFMLSTYTWMLGEGTYLQLLLLNTWRVETWQIWTIVVSCWTLPFLSMIPYVVTRATSEEEDKSCWMDHGSSTWFLGIPVILTLTINLVFVINVIRVIKRKRNLQSTESSQASTNQSQASTMKAARAALMLVPILGLHFIILPIRPEDGSVLEYIYEIVSAVSTSFQGFLVSLIFCFLNSEVLDLLKKKFLRAYRNRLGSANLEPGDLSRKVDGRTVDGQSLTVAGVKRKRRSSAMLMTETVILTTANSPSVTTYDGTSHRQDVTRV